MLFVNAVYELSQECRISLSYGGCAYFAVFRWRAVEVESAFWVCAGLPILHNVGLSASYQPNFAYCVCIQHSPTKVNLHRGNTIERLPRGITIFHVSKLGRMYLNYAENLLTCALVYMTSIEPIKANTAVRKQGCMIAHDRLCGSRFPWSPVCSTPVLIQRQRGSW